MILNKKLEIEILKFHDSYWDYYLKGNVEGMIQMLDDNYTQVGSAEMEVFSNKPDAAKFLHETINQVAGNLEMRNRITKIESQGELFIAHELCDVYVKTDEKWVFYSKFRATSLIQHKNGGWKFIHQHSSFPDSRTGEGENVAIEKVALENEQLKEAIKRRTIELEHQNRELEIEAAVEKVRSASMAMQTTDDFTKVNKELLFQLNKLEIPGLTGVSFYLVDENEIVSVRDLSSPGNMSDPSIYAFQFDSKKYPTLGEFVGIWKAADLDYFILDFPKEKLVLTVEELQHIQPEVAQQFKNAIDSGVLTHQWNPVGRLTNGILSIDLMQPPTGDTKTIVLKMAGAFNMAYQRFLDLQKAEAQARESQIEAAIERVRSSSMSIHNSKELIQVVRVLNKETLGLGIEFNGTQILTDFVNLDDGVNSWFSVEGQDHLEKFHIPPFEDPIYKRSYEAYHAGVDYFTESYSKNEKNEFFKLLYNKSDFRSIPKERQDLVFAAPVYIRAVVFSKNSVLVFQRFFPKEFAKEDEEIFKRFGKAFEQAYVRFLDLQKAEAQAREAQIQLALERVRARTMAMQKSNELPEAANLLFQQVQSLGMPAWSAGYCIWNGDEKSAITLWMSSEGVLQPPFTAPTTEDELFIEMRQGQEEGKTFHMVEMGGKKLVKHYQYMRTLPVVGAILDSIIEAGHPLPTFQIMHHAYFSKGFLLFITYEPVPDAHAIFKRFASVFDQTYTRFLDLQKSEAQAREAQIEAALEKVRSRSLAMHRSDELNQVIAEVFDRLNELKLVFDATGIQLFKEGSKNSVQWIRGKVLSAPVFINHPFDEEAFTHSEVVTDIWKAKESGSDIFNHTYSFNEKNKYVEYVSRYNEIPVKDLMLQAPGYTATIIMEKNSALWVDSWYGLTISTEDYTILKRVARVFEQSYVRFLDLQKAEAQVREAQIEAALERVRSRTMAMHKSDELADTVKLLLNELGRLEIGVISSWISFINAADNNIDLWVTHDVHMPLILSHFKGGDNESFQEDIDIWKKKIPYLKKSIPADIAIPLLKNLFDVNLKKISGLESNYHMLQVPHKYGFIGSGTWAEANAENIQILQRIATVFDQTYTRFLDLQKAEIQAKEAQIEVALERVRSRALAMQNSNELIEIANVMREQMGLLGQSELETTAVHLYTEGASTFDSWYAFRDGNQESGKVFAGRTLFKIDSSELTREMLSFYNADAQDYTLEASGSRLEEFSNVLKAAIPDIKRSPPQAYYHFSDFSGGSLLMVSYQPPSEESKYLLKKCASVFDLAYRRYLDLKLAEEQTEQTRLNLIQIQAEKIKAEEALIQLKSTQAQLVQSEKMASLGELTAGIAHEIQNPLNFVNNFSELNRELVTELNDELAIGNEQLAKDNKQDVLLKIQSAIDIAKDIKDNSEKINHHGQRAASIVKGMLEHSRKSSGEKTLTDINALCDEYLRLSYFGFKAKDKNLPTGEVGFNADYKTDLDPNMPKINVVSQDIARVLLNIMNNAFQACAENLVVPISIGMTTIPPKDQRGSSQSQNEYKPLVSVSTKYPGDKVEISITDNGPGIPDSIKDKIFQPFFTTKPTGQGTGLGLSLAYDIVKAHGGTIEINSKEGEGTGFIIKLPL